MTERATGSNAFPPIQHVILIIKKNRTFDQVLSDMHDADGDSTLQYFPLGVSL
jgi:phospholipase C